MPVTFLPISFTAAVNSGARRPVMKTFAPSSTNTLAVARPIPLLPPVTRAVFPSSFPMDILRWRSYPGRATSVPSEERARLVERQARQARKHRGWIAVAEVAEEVRLHVPFGKELLLAAEAGL